MVVFVAPYAKIFMTALSCCIVDTLFALWCVRWRRDALSQNHELCSALDQYFRTNKNVPFAGW